MNGKIPIGDARKISKERGLPMVLIFGIEATGNRFSITTYGRSKALCKLAASLGEQFASAILKGTVGPPEKEPDDLPDVGAIYEGEWHGL